MASNSSLHDELRENLTILPTKRKDLKPYTINQSGRPQLTETKGVQI